jgi:hypothetical protein
MPRMQDWKRDIHEGLRKENWSLTGPNRIVKVLPGGGTPAAALGGYITLGRFLLGKTPHQIENSLGLPFGYLKMGARIYSFARLPMACEYEYELTALHPGGLVFNPAHSDPNYLPGDRATHQWRIKPGVQIPVNQKNFLELSPTQRLSYDWLK